MFPPPLWQRFSLSTSLIICQKWGLGLLVLHQPNCEGTEINRLDRLVGFALVANVVAKASAR
ncbi:MULTISPECIES: hypothetical protein [unclassified Tolypothrix]|uniref:hypothetical protein n=1 Tax=unclassified Tolypothrix TaxID=2649714 RepID=UPI0005EAB70E|nr:MULTISPECIES: hypothetical protein [unclassified Tolypothrix]EKE99678.1 hypothetical protein FDUTEX481_09554 [Tolypothrix sp. PCC 7601]MBE9081587.1 hypothetical protein [Tolypothrix sp. LEGE 11397]UYD25153.1 hypothetical protein HGR01_27755 [Tolypothrix sp. PCC 7712]UYD32608.1 hypothetical protein HG267_26865 [Tolypothrix sp. PCC 7601]